jgi:hypothetical protein
MCDNARNALLLSGLCATTHEMRFFFSGYVRQRTECFVMATDTPHHARAQIPGAVRRIRSRNQSTAHRCLSASYDQEKNMNKFGRLFRPLTWLMAVLLAGLVAGCGSSGGGGGDGGFGGVCAGTACVPLGTAGTYVILAKSGISTVPTSAITGNLGVSPISATAITGFSLTADSSNTFSRSAQVTGKVFAANYQVPTPGNLGTAVLDMQAAYTDAAGRAPTSAATTNVGAGTLTSLTLTPGVYEWGTAVTIPTDLTFNGSATDVWILKVAGTLDMAAAQNVILMGGAQSKNIFWQVSGAVTIGATTHFEGIVLGQTTITFGNLASVNGRLLAQTAVVLDANTVTQPL